MTATAIAAAPNVRCSIIKSDGSIVAEAPLDASDPNFAAGSFVWVDTIDPTPEQMLQIQQRFDLHPLAIEDASDMHQRGKIEAYENFWFIVAHAFVGGESFETSEVAIFAGDRFVVTVRHAPAWPTDEVERRWHTLKALLRDPGAFVYTILDTIVDGYLPYVALCEGRLEAIETKMLQENAPSTKAVLADILNVKYSLQILRHVVGPMQDVVSRISRGDIEIFGEDEMVYYRNVAAHVKRLLSRIDGINEMVSIALSLNVSIASQRQADIARQLTIIATIFLPLTYVTGFFGQNFGFLVEHITSQRSFLIWGVGAEVLAVVGLLAFIKSRRWM